MSKLYCVFDVLLFCVVSIFNIFNEMNEDISCQCNLNNSVSLTKKDETSERKEFIFNAVARTEHYLRERRIPELIRFFFTKIISEHPNRPLSYLEALLDDCMLFRAGHGLAPVLYEESHLKAVLKSFDPGNRGWLSAGQIRRLYGTLGFTVKDVIEDRMPTDEILNDLKETQENDLLQLLSATSSNFEIKKTFCTTILENL